MDGPGEREQAPFEAIVIGTGFGGAVTACRLAQAGVRLCILERGRRYSPEDFPALPREGELLPDARRWLWESGQGLWDARDVGDIAVFQAAGWGGGSLVYANVHLRPSDDVFDDQWPADIQREHLAREYDLVGSMLDIRAVAGPDGAPPSGMAGKVRAMRDAFEAVAGPACVFHPPVAIKLDDPHAPPKDNGHGRLQRGCQSCGACDVGCPHAAKNTLDFNYLAEAEKRGNAQIYTLAEVRMISRHDAADIVGYTVHFTDHLTGQRRSVVAPTVFVCAGALNTTELLLHSQQQGRLSREHGAHGTAGFDPAFGAGLPDLGPGLGRGYFANADSIGAVYDTARPVDPDSGPVITTVLAYDHRREDGTSTSFLVEDGGYPRPLRRFVASLDSPLWLDRNRLDDRDGPPPSLPGLAAETPPRPERWSSVLDGLTATLLAGDLPVDRIVPAQLRGVVAEMHERLTRRLDAEVEAVAGPVSDHYLDRAAEECIKLARWVGVGFLPAFQRRLRRFIHDLAARRIDLTPSDIRDRAIETARRLWDLDKPDRALRRLLAWLGGEPDPVADGQEPLRDPWSHRAVLLCMGRDDTAGQVRLEDGRLSVRYPLGIKATTYSEEERVMRAVARELGGRLRTSPLWAFGRRAVTVHGQGGCAMRAPLVEHPVTDEYGEVLQSPGLFVNDGALFPISVGVNPSSTIAALAERNVRHAWESRFRKRAQDELPWARDVEAAAAWGAAQDPRALTPPRHAVALREPEPIGLEFEEGMTGFWSEVTSRTSPAELELSRSSLSPLSPYLASELKGRAEGRRVSFTLRCAVPDVDAFLVDPARPVRVAGTVRLESGQTAREGACTGEMHLLTEPRRDRRDITYTLSAMLPATADAAAEQLRLVGFKRIKDEPGLDAWMAGTTLYTDVWMKDSDRLLPGILRLSLADFLTVQMPSMKVTGTEDPARIAWTLGRFVAFFFGSFQRVYLPELERLTHLLEPDPRSPRSARVDAGSRR